MAGYKYEWQCPNCGTQLQLKMRVTQTKRKCPHCATLVTPQEIDRQTAEKTRSVQMGGLLVMIFILFVLVACGLSTGLFGR
jgi:phage terminase large subunit GpA-like protein